MGTCIKRPCLLPFPALVLLSALLFMQACSRTSAASSSINKGSDGVALKGYDVVASGTYARKGEIVPFLEEGAVGLVALQGLGSHVELDTAIPPPGE